MAEPDLTAPPRPPILEALHDALVVLLIAMRPLCWDGAPGQPADLIWQGAAGLACLGAALERAAGLRRAWRWSWRWLPATALILGLLGPALHAPEAIEGWCRWTGWAACACAAVYLAQVIEGRRALAVAACGGALAVLAALGIGQRLVSLPAMAASLASGDPAFAAAPVTGAEFAERLANGGAYATFTTANQFAAWLVLAIPLALGLVIAARGAARVLPALLVLAGLAALAASGAKGGVLALAAGLGLAWWLAWPGRWWRWLPLPLAAIAALGLLLSGLAADSIAVRAGYWRNALDLIAAAPWSGHGLGGFAALQAQVLQPGDGPTRFVHNEALEAAVAGGWWLGVLAVAALAALAWPRRATGADADADAEASRRPAALVPWLLVPALVYLAALGALGEIVGHWPGGGHILGQMAWALLLGAVGAAVAWRLAAIPAPPAWAWGAGLAAVALKALIDFDLHAGGVAGSALLLAAAAPGAVRRGTGMAWRLLPCLGAAAVIVLVVAAALAGLRHASAAGWLAQARIASADRAAHALLAHELGMAEDQPPGPVAAAARRAWDGAEGSTATRFGALHLLPYDADGLELARRLAEDAPHHAGAALEHARRLVAARAPQHAIEEARRAAALAPSSPRVLLQAAVVADRAVRLHPARADWRTLAAELRDRARALDPRVYPSERLPPEALESLDGSGQTPLR